MASRQIVSRAAVLRLPPGFGIASSAPERIRPVYRMKTLTLLAQQRAERQDAGLLIVVGLALTIRPCNGV